MTGDADADPGAADVEALASVCGCAGKTPLDRVVYPARDRLRALLADAPVTLADAEDAAVLPLTAGLTRAVERRPLDAEADGDGDADAGNAERDGAVDASARVDRTWTLAATLGGDDVTDPERFAERLEPAYAALADRGPVTVGKGHSVQVAAATTSRQWFEHLRPAGDDRPGYRTANVDVIHALPALSPTRQARVAMSNALNDCYAVGGTDERVVRPLLAVPADAPPPSDVREWYAAAAPEGVAVRPAAVVEHDGRGWLFGATATAAAPGRRPPRESAVRSEGERGRPATPVEAGDVVVVHRPLGGLALYVLAVASDDPTARDRALTALTADHRDVASALATFRPAAGEAFDPDRHLKLATDVSGPGVEGIARRVGCEGDCRLHLTALPLLDEAALARVRDRWLVPDVTVETNGPLAVVARPAVADGIVERLSALPGATPRRLGRLRRADTAPGAGSLTVADDVPAGRYVESLLRRPGVDE